MKFIIFFFLLHQTNGKFSQPQLLRRPVNESDIQSGNDVFPSWGNADSFARGLLNNIGTSLGPLGFEFMTSLNISSKCSGGLISYAKGLYDMKYWAFAMFDSSGILPNGISGGKMTYLGDFDLCTSTEAPNFRGKYCFVDFKIFTSKMQNYQPVDKKFPEFINIESEHILERAARYAKYLKYMKLRISLCLPSVCTTDEVKKIFSTAVTEFTKLETEIDVPYCEEKNGNVPYTSGEILLLILICSLILLVIAGTVLEVFLRLKTLFPEKNKQGIPLKLILCFSAYSNVNRIIQDDLDPESIPVFHGMRVITMLWIALLHTYVIHYPQIYDGLIYALDMQKELLFQPIINGTAGVDTFFFMSAVLLTYKCLKGKMGVLSQIMKRYYRLTPTLMLVVACCCILHHFGSGPFWREIMRDNLAKHCKNYGWSTMLYFTNYNFHRDVCLKWTWYLSAEFHLYVIGVFVVNLLRKNHRKGLITIGFLIITGIVISAFCHIYYNFIPIPISLVYSDDKGVFARKGYVPTHYHLSVFCIGIFVGYIFATKKVQIPKNINLMGWTITIATVSYLLFGTYYWRNGDEPGLFVSTLYVSTHRCAWALCLAFITLSCNTGQGGIINSFLASKMFVPFSRLTYICFLIHFVVLYVYQGSIRTTITYNHQSLVVLFLGLMFITFFFAFVLALIFELPFIALIKLWTKKPQEEKIVQTGNGVEKDLKKHI